MSGNGLADRIAALGIASGPADSEGAALVKTVLLKDKHSHVYAVVALNNTDISLKSLSMRLGLGKALLAPPPPAALPALLQAPAAAASSFLGLVEPAAGDVVCLLDSQVAAAPSLRVPAGDGTGEITMTGADVEKFLRSLGGAVSAMDLTLSPKIDRDNPPDLKQLADRAAPIEAVKAAAAASAALAPAGKPAAKPQKAGAARGGVQTATLDLDRIVSTVVDRCLQFAASQPSRGTEGETYRTLLADVRMEVNSLKNGAYAAGFSAARGALKAQLEPQVL